MVNPLKVRLSKLEGRTPSNQREVIEAMQAKLAEPDLSDHKKALITAILYRQEPTR